MPPRSPAAAAPMGAQGRSSPVLWVRAHAAHPQPQPKPKRPSRCGGTDGMRPPHCHEPAPATVPNLDSVLLCVLSDTGFKPKSVWISQNCAPVNCHCWSAVCQSSLSMCHCCCGVFYRSLPPYTMGSPPALSFTLQIHTSLSPLKISLLVGVCVICSILFAVTVGRIAFSVVLTSQCQTS